MCVCEARRISHLAVASGEELITQGVRPSIVQVGRGRDDTHQCRCVDARQPKQVVGVVVGEPYTGVAMGAADVGVEKQVTAPQHLRTGRANFGMVDIADVLDICCNPSVLT